MFLALALAALNQDKRLRPSPMFRAQENSPTKTVGYEYILRVTMRQQQELFRSIPGEVVAPSEEVSELGDAGGFFEPPYRLRLLPRLSGARVQERPDIISDSAAPQHSVPGSGTLPGSSVAPALSLQLAPGGECPGASRTAADRGLKQPSTLSDGADA